MRSEDNGGTDAGASETDPRRVPPPLEDLGRRWRTYRQRRKSPVPPAVLALIAVGVGLALWAGGWMFVVVVKVWAVLIPLAVALGIAGNYFAPMPGRHGRLRVTVYDNGVVVRTNTGVESIVKWRQPGKAWKRVRPGEVELHPYLIPVWKTEDGREVDVALDRFGSSTSLRKALVDREFEPFPLRKRIGLGSAGAIAVAALIAWAFTLDPFPLPEDHQDLDRFCGDPSMTFERSPQYEGDGPHPMQVWPLGWVSDSTDTVAKQPWSGNPEETVLIACGEEGAVTEEIGSCGYTDDPADLGEVTQSVSVYLMAYHFEVFEAATHRQVGEVTVNPEKPEAWACPPYIPEGQESIEMHPSAEEAAEALTPFVELPADT